MNIAEMSRTRTTESCTWVRGDDGCSTARGAVRSALGGIAFTLLWADIPGGRAFSRANPAGIPLWPTIVWFAVVFPLVGGIVGLLLPLYKFRHGGSAVGVLSLLALCVLTIAADPGLRAGQIGLEVGGHPPWQNALVAASVVIMTAVVADGLRPLVVGTKAAPVAE
jgi:hypothetical protein